MTTVETPARSPHLAFGTTFREAFGTVFGEIGPFTQVAAIPLLLSLTLLVLDFSFRAAIVLANMPRNLWNLVANFVVFAMGYGALASAYAQLSGWNGPREDILERFE